MFTSKPRIDITDKSKQTPKGRAQNGDRVETNGNSGADQRAANGVKRAFKRESNANGSQKREHRTTREQLMGLLSEDEVSRMSTSADPLVDGDEYIDLGELRRGICRSQGATPPMEDVLRRSAVEATTWSRLVSELGPRDAPAPR